jgi:hypothetical protein
MHLHRARDISVTKVQKALQHPQAEAVEGTAEVRYRTKLGMRESLYGQTT